MDTKYIPWINADEFDSYREAYHRRADPERYWDGASDTIPADFDDNEDAWNDQRRRERLAETCYET